jgi:hypothetical protein
MAQNAEKIASMFAKGELLRAARNSARPSVPPAPIPEWRFDQIVLTILGVRPICIFPLLGSNSNMQRIEFKFGCVLQKV